MTTLTSSLSEKLKRCLGEPENNWTLPSECYTSQEVYSVEQETIFRRGWVGVGRADRWTAPGHFVALEVGGVPLVVVRGDDGVLRAFANTCRHRAAQIMEGEGHCARMRCRFHFWTYARDGRLVGAPRMGNTPGFVNEDFGLVEFAMVEWEGFALVSLAENPSPFEQWVGEFSQIHKPWKGADLVTARRREFSVECNWKSFAEVFNEYYHLPYVHPTSIDATYNAPDASEKVEGAFATHFGTTEGTGALLDDQQKTGQNLPVMEQLVGRLRAGVRYSWIFPNLAVAYGSDALWMYEVHPDGPRRCQVVMWVCFPQSTLDLPDFAKKSGIYFERFDAALDEDIPMLEQQFRGQNSPFSRQGRHADLEPNVARFADWYAKRLLACDEGKNAYSTN
ncbi:MAG TPA: aromatic ring-hydroxylating dioxygenase subunit alpha [Acidimicrobiia bacterium]|nr:aromatic ring-hydroxylating dioxygenase subunit alpha [Acidimicrobiia bacterium]HIL47330.1 aromatic ring-hydroxylating dioxygenase subunit alpha [Acidimicrobiia bacterium]